MTEALYNRTLPVLANGGLVLEERPGRLAGDGVERTTFVLCYLPDSWDRYAVWTRVWPPDRSSFCIDGFYTNSLSTALADFKGRR